MLACGHASMSGDQEACLRAGMDAYTSKPVSPQALMKSMAQALAAEARWVQGERPQAPSTGAVESKPTRPSKQARSQPTPALDTDKLRRRLGNDPAALADWASSVQTELAGYRQGLTEALTRQDKVHAAAQAHALKGSLASLTAQRAAALANGLEMAARSGEWPLFGRALPVVLSELDTVDKSLQSMRDTDRH